MVGRIGLGGGEWVVRSPATGILFLGDILGIVGVLAWGLTVHHVDLVAQFDHAARSVLPFIVGWLLIAPVAGAYSPRAWSSLRIAVAVVIGSWIGAAFIGSAIRATPLIPGGAPPIFVLVTIGTGLGVLVPWRIVAVVIGRKWNVWDTSIGH